MHVIQKYILNTLRFRYVFLYTFVALCNVISRYTLQYEDLSIARYQSVQCSSSPPSLPASAIKYPPFRHPSHSPLSMTRKWKLTLATVFFQNKDSSDRVKFRRRTGKVFKKGQPPKKVNRPSDTKLKKNGSSISEPYLKNEPFSSYGQKRGFQKRA